MKPYTTNNGPAAGRDLLKTKKKKEAAERPKDSPSVVQLGEHGRYQIKSGRLSGEYVARAFPKPPTSARGLIAEAKGVTEEAAIAALYDVIDAREVQRTEDRRIDPKTGIAVPSADEYAEAMSQVRLSSTQRALLTALAFAGEDGLPEMRAASAAGCKSTTSVNRALASAGLLIANYLSLETTPDDASVGTRFLGYRGEESDDEDRGRWILYAELRDAVRATR